MWDLLFKRSNEEERGSRGVGCRQGRRVGGVGTDGLFTKGSGVTGMLYISSVSCPGFPTNSREQKGEEDRVVDADKFFGGGLWECTLITKTNSILRYSV